MTDDLVAAGREAGFDVVHLASVGSTNAEALALEGRDRVFVVADRQTEGRGRHGRDWVSPRGNLYASLRLVDPAPARQAATLSFVAGLALADAIAAHAPASAAALRLKWPNDVLIDGAKAAGILIEGRHGADGLVAVIGCGVNVASHPLDTPYPATALSVRDPGVAVAGLFARLAEAFARRLAQWARGEGFATIRRDWLARAAGLGDPIIVRLPAGDLAGRFVALDEAGHLILDDGTGHRAIAAGEVFLTGISRTDGAG